jgi:hypothetical protein
MRIGRKEKPAGWAEDRQSSRIVLLRMRIYWEITVYCGFALSGVEVVV